MKKVIFSTIFVFLIIYTIDLFFVKSRTIDTVINTPIPTISPQYILDCSGDKRRILENRSDYQVKYSLIPFNNYNVPTCSPVESQIYLPIWKQVFQKVNSMNDEYFNTHISVIAAWVDEFELEGKLEKRFSLTYYYQIDWARVRLNEAFTYSFEGIGEGITTEELLRDVDLPTYKTKFKKIIDIQKLKPVSHIVSKEQIQKAVKNTSPILRYNVNEGIFVDRDGNLAMGLGGTIDERANKCLSGRIILETAEVKDLGESACVIYEE